MRRKLRAETFDEGAVVERCFVCGQEFQYGPRRYAGKFIPRYQILACEVCYGAAWDGWGPGAEAKILTHLEAKGIPVPPRNDKGWLPRD